MYRVTSSNEGAGKGIDLKRLSAVFAVGRERAPSVVFFDECDGLMHRSRTTAVAHLKAEFQAGGQGAARLLGALPAWPSTDTIMVRWHRALRSRRRSPTARQRRLTFGISAFGPLTVYSVCTGLHTRTR